MEKCKYSKFDTILLHIISIILSILGGSIIGYIFSLSMIPRTINFIKIALVMSIISVAIILGSLFTANILKPHNNFRKAICKHGRIIFLGTIGTFLATTITATIGINIATVASTILVGLSAGFFILMTISIIYFICYIINSSLEIVDILE